MGVKDVGEGRKKITNCMALLFDAAIVCGPVQDANRTEQVAKLAFLFVDPAQKEPGTSLHGQGRLETSLESKFQTELDLT